MSFSQQIPAWDKDRIQRRIAALTRGEWTAQFLLDFVSSIILAGVVVTCHRFSLSQADCMRLWDLTFPASYRGITNQTALVMELRAAAAKEASDAAA